MTDALNIVVVEPDRERAIEIVDALRAQGRHDVLVLGDATGLARRIAGRAPDLVLVDAGDPSRDAIEDLALATGPLERPVALFVDRSPEGAARAAAEAGVAAYVAGGLDPARLLPVLEAAIARWTVGRRLRDELAETRRALEERKVIDRAKGLLMKARGLDEAAAYALLRRTAMDRGRRVADVAAALVDAADLLS